VTVDIQVYLPGGGTPNHPIAILLSSDDGRFCETVFTKRDGSAFATGLQQDARVTVLVPEEPGIYQSTSSEFIAQDGRLVVHLKPFPGAPLFAVSAGDLHKPHPKARKLYERARKDLQNGRLLEAKSKLIEASTRDSLYTAPLILLGRIHLGQREYVEAELAYQRALERNPRSVEAEAGLGVALSSRGEHQRAIDPLEKAAQLTPNPEVQFRLGVALMETGRLKEAEEILQSLAANSSDLSAGSEFMLGRLYVLQGDREKGIFWFESFLAKQANGLASDAARRSLDQLRRLPPHSN